MKIQPFCFSCSGVTKDGFTSPSGASRYFFQKAPPVFGSLGLFVVSVLACWIWVQTRPKLSRYFLVISGFATAYYLLGHIAEPSLSPLGAFVFSMTSFHGRGFFPGGIKLDDPLTVLAAIEASRAYH